MREEERVLTVTLYLPAHAVIAVLISALVDPL